MVHYTLHGADCDFLVSTKQKLVQESFFTYPGLLLLLLTGTCLTEYTVSKSVIMVVETVMCSFRGHDSIKYDTV